MDQWSERRLKACFYVAVAAIALAGLWFNIEPKACPVPTALLSGEKPPQPVCFEFWFNRYQTLIGAFVAVAAATAAWLGVMKQVTEAQHQVREARLQVGEMRKQTVLAQQDSAAVRCEQLNKILSELRKLEVLLGELHVRHRSARLIQHRIFGEPNHRDYVDAIAKHLDDFSAECAKIDQLFCDLTSLKKGIFPTNLFQSQRWERPYNVVAHETSWILGRNERFKTDNFERAEYKYIRIKIEVAMLPEIANIENDILQLERFICARIDSIQRKYDEAAGMVIGQI